MVVRAARRNGDLEGNPKGVYDTVVGRLMEFRESLIEQQTRADRDFEQCTKGRLTAVQFLPVWEAVISELEQAGAGAVRVKDDVAVMENASTQTVSTRPP